MREVLADKYVDLPRYTFADMKQDQMEQLEFETRYAEVIYKLLKRLDEANLIGQ